MIALYVGAGCLQQTQFELVINLKAAKALGLNDPAGAAAAGRPVSSNEPAPAPGAPIATPSSQADLPLTATPRHRGSVPEPKKTAKLAVARPAKPGHRLAT